MMLNNSHAFKPNQDRVKISDSGVVATMEGQVGQATPATRGRIPSEKMCRVDVSLYDSQHSDSVNLLHRLIPT